MLTKSVIFADVAVVFFSAGFEERRPDWAGDERAHIMMVTQMSKTQARQGKLRRWSSSLIDCTLS
jgi:hypothetical protein